MKKPIFKDVVILEEVSPKRLKLKFKHLHKCLKYPFVWIKRDEELTSYNNLLEHFNISEFDLEKFVGKELGEAEFTLFLEELDCGHWFIRANFLTNQV